jgi:formate C-acetyltransferase
MEQLTTEAEKAEHIKHAIELISCFYMRRTDHLLLTPDMANGVFGGSSSDQATTLGGMTPQGDEGVCEINLITNATPSMNNDTEVMASLEEFNYESEDDIYLQDPKRVTGFISSLLYFMVFVKQNAGHTSCMACILFINYSRPASTFFIAASNFLISSGDNSGRSTVIVSLLSLAVSGNGGV